MENPDNQQVLSEFLEYLESTRRHHMYCEDNWYSCPKQSDGCSDPSKGTECNCEADEFNEKLDAAILKLKKLIKTL